MPELSAIGLFALLSGVLLWLLFREHAATVARLTAANTELTKHNERLVEALTPALRRFDKAVEGSRTAADLIKNKHTMSRGERDARCTCGWTFHSDDPALLQSQIATHFKDTSPAVRAGRTSWPRVIRTAEREADELAEQAIAKERANET